MLKALVPRFPTPHVESTVLVKPMVLYINLHPYTAAGFNLAGIPGARSAPQQQRHPSPTKRAEAELNGMMGEVGAVRA